ncbi:D-serine ammonia-lyase [Planococcus sp. CAU13]|uniref:D-serine ammonia-lyase n=1 Tax=Planococcus sp. CAU13 TaxID=1541197 RepID=UPI00052FF5A3|nr:D-serine ammonia-lyase [Planococcus sp. CAU13]
MAVTQQQIEEWQQKFPLLSEVTHFKPVFWLNPKLQNVADTGEFAVTKQEMQEAEELWQRFAPFLAVAFPETAEAGGIIESPLTEIAGTQKLLEEKYGAEIPGKLFLKCDNALPVAGSIKARGGFYEVLHYAEQLAIENGMITPEDDYSQFASDKFREFFSRYSIGVGSTGNLGLSIGIISSKLGFSVSVYMSADAKAWKKELLRAKGAIVHEFEGDFGEAILEGRQQTKEDPMAYFVDDESSKHLYLGYSTAAFRVKQQLDEMNITVDDEHPLIVYLPCGVGGSPGGITFGLKQIYGDAVHCFFVEPTHSPSVLIGLMTGEKERVCVQDFGIDNMTEGDGLAVGRPSSFASGISEKLISGIYTLEDEELFRLLAVLADGDGIYVEPSAASSLLGPVELAKTDYLAARGLSAENAAHIAWSTGGDLVPENDMREMYRRGKSSLE